MNTTAQLYRKALPLLTAATLFSASAGVQAQAAQGHADLQQVQQRLDALEKVIADTENSHSKESAELARAERAVARARRELRELEKQRKLIGETLDLLEKERVEVQTRIDTRQAELAEWIKRHYMHGGTDIAPILSAGDPNQLARDIVYLEHMGRARLELIESLRADMGIRDGLIGATAERLGEVATLEKKQKTLQDELEKEQKQRKRAVARLSEQLKSQKQAAEALREDEQRLGRVVAELARQAAEERLRLSTRRQEEERRATTQSSPPERKAIRPGELAAGSVQTLAGKRFADMRGQMRFPVKGTLGGRFGAPRNEGATLWRGIFIRASSGETVTAVAGGAVVFSDWLRGYGNLIIIDHGDDYLTVYGNNDVLFHSVGDLINVGDSIASVGESGGGEGTGLYFEIRHKGEPQDPVNWLRRG